MREKTKLKLRSKRERLVERPQALSNLPTSVIMAAQQLMNGSHDYEERAHSARGRDRVIAQQPRSFRRIQSAHQVRWVVKARLLRSSLRFSSFRLLLLLAFWWLLF